MKAAQRDASWFSSHGRGGRWHVVVGTQSACGIKALVFDAAVDARVVPLRSRCARAGCASRFKAHDHKPEEE